MSEERKLDDDGTALALYIELTAYFDPKLTEHDKRIVLDKIKYRTSNTLIEEQAARIAEMELAQSEYEKVLNSYADENQRLSDKIDASQARLSEAVKVLEEVLAACDEVVLFQGDQITGHILSAALDRSKAKAFITTLGGEDKQ